MSRLLFSCFIILFGAFACQHGEQHDRSSLPREGAWRGIIHTQGKEIPFNFRLEWKDDNSLEVMLINGEEQIRISESSVQGDSVYIPMHIFDAEIVARFQKGQMKGYWQKKYAKDYRIPFSGIHGETYRFVKDPKKPTVDISGRWEVYFENASGRRLAVGEFKQEGNKVSGTFLRPSGDYRYLVGEIDGEELFLSTFDGEHAYLFTARVHEDRLSGDFFSGKTRHDTWTATRNEEIALADHSEIAYLDEGFESIDFRLPDLNGDTVSLQDMKFRDKALIIQVFGTWCPNCMDETRFLSEWYNQRDPQNLQIIAIAFERKNDLQYAKNRIEKLKSRFDIRYEFLFGGTSDSESKKKALPMIQGSVAFPTLIVIDRDGLVRWIHSGFSGPGTGQHYEEFVAEFNALMDKILD